MGRRCYEAPSMRDDWTPADSAEAWPRSGPGTADEACTLSGLRQPATLRSTVRARTARGAGNRLDAHLAERREHRRVDDPRGATNDAADQPEFGAHPTAASWRTRCRPLSDADERLAAGPGASRLERPGISAACTPVRAGHYKIELGQGAGLYHRRTAPCLSATAPCTRRVVQAQAPRAPYG